MSPKGSSSNREENSEGLISSSFGVRGSGEGSTDEYWDVKYESSDSIVERLSWLDADSFRRGSPWSVGKEEFPKKLSKIALPSTGVRCAKEPPAAMSSLRADSMSKPEQKMFNDTSLGIDKSGLDAKSRKNLAQAAPMNSFSNCSKSRMSIGREFMHLVRENE